MIVEILRSSDLATVTPKRVRRELEKITNQSYDQQKKELKQLIEKCYDKVSHEAYTVTGKPKATSASKEKGKTVGKVKKERKKRVLDPVAREKNKFTRTWLLSPELAAVTGEAKLSRTGVVKALWKYIKANDLQDPAQRTYILCDDKLQKVFDGETRLSSFAMNKYISQHLRDLPTPPTDVSPAT